MTGSGSRISRGAQMLRKRQSSLSGSSSLAVGARAKAGPVCMQIGANVVASRTPFHTTTGCGGFQRRSPIGGAA